METDEERYLLQAPPNDVPQFFAAHLISDDHLAHAGIFSPDLKQYYFSLSNKDLNQFDAMFSTQCDGQWGEPATAFFNSNYMEHGVRFTLDGHARNLSSIPDS